MKDLLGKIFRKKKNDHGHNIVHYESGNQPKNIFHYVRVGIIFEGLIDVITLLPWVNKKDLVVLIDQIQRQYKIDVLNDYIIKHQEFLDYRVETDVDISLKDYEYEVSYYLIKNKTFLGDPPDLAEFMNENRQSAILPE